jgi:hypothetical protein
MRLKTTLYGLTQIFEPKQKCTSYVEKKLKRECTCFFTIKITIEIK